MNRLAEHQANLNGFSTPMSWGIAIKANWMQMLVAIIMVISGFSLGDIADEAITWIDKYDDDTGKDSTNSEISNGDSAGWDIALHMVTAIYGMFFLGIMSISSYIFAWTWLDI